MNGLLLTAFALDNAQRARIEERFSQMCHVPVSLEVRVDASLIAGVRVVLGGRMYDGTLRGQLDTLLETMRREGGALHD